MRFIGFNFTKISVERFAPVKTGVKIQTSVDIKEIKTAKADLFNSKEDFLEVKFSYSVKYEPKAAELNFEGLVLIAAESKEAKEILKSWKKKELPEEFRIQVVNIVMRKANLKALVFEDEMNLPLHVPLPALRKVQKEEK